MGNVVLSYYDTIRGWIETNKGWHEITILNTSVDKQVEMVNWLYDHIDNPERHTRWIFVPGLSSSFKFRYERDFIMFTLRWS